MNTLIIQILGLVIIILGLYKLVKINKKHKDLIKEENQRKIQTEHLRAMTQKITQEEDPNLSSSDQDYELVQLQKETNRILDEVEYLINPNKKEEELKRQAIINEDEKILLWNKQDYREKIEVVKILEEIKEEKEKSKKYKTHYICTHCNVYALRGSGLYCPSCLNDKYLKKVNVEI